MLLRLVLAWNWKEERMDHCAFSQLTKLSVSDTGKCTVVDTKVENIEG
jgi:hypothetical protein